MNIPVACFLIYLLCLFQLNALFISNCVFSRLQLSFSEFLTRPFALLLAVSFVNFSHVLSYCQSSPFPVETASFPNFKRVLSQFERHYFLILTTPFFSFFPPLFFFFFFFFKFQPIPRVLSQFQLHPFLILQKHSFSILQKHSFSIPLRSFMIPVVFFLNIPTFNRLRSQF